MCSSNLCNSLTVEMSEKINIHGWECNGRDKRRCSCPEKLLLQNGNFLFCENEYKVDEREISSNYKERWRWSSTYFITITVTSISNNTFHRMMLQSTEYTPEALPLTYILDCHHNNDFVTWSCSEFACPRPSPNSILSLLLAACWVHFQPTTLAPGTSTQSKVSRLFSINFPFP